MYAAISSKLRVCFLTQKLFQKVSVMLCLKSIIQNLNFNLEMFKYMQVNYTVFVFNKCLTIALISIKNRNSNSTPYIVQSIM